MDGKSPQERNLFLLQRRTYYQGTGGAFSLVAAKVHTFLLGRKNLFHRPFRKMKITPRKKKGGGEEENYKGEVRCSGIKRDGERRGGGSPSSCCYCYTLGVCVRDVLLLLSPPFRQGEEEEDGGGTAARVGLGSDAASDGGSNLDIAPSAVAPSLSLHPQPFFLSPLLQSQVLSFFFRLRPGKKGRKPYRRFPSYYFFL